MRSTTTQGCRLLLNVEVASASPAAAIAWRARACAGDMRLLMGKDKDYCITYCSMDQALQAYIKAPGGDEFTQQSLWDGTWKHAFLPAMGRVVPQGEPVQRRGLLSKG